MGTQPLIFLKGILAALENLYILMAVMSLLGGDGLKERQNHRALGGGWR